MVGRRGLGWWLFLGDSGFLGWQTEWNTRDWPLLNRMESWDRMGPGQTVDHLDQTEVALQLLLP
jgi:hypothetical protein